MSNRKYMLIGWYSRNVTQMMSLTTRFQILILLLNFKRFSDFHDNVSHSHIVVLYTNAEVYVLDLGSREPMNARVALRVIMHLQCTSPVTYNVSHRIFSIFFFFINLFRSSS